MIVVYNILTTLLLLLSAFSISQGQQSIFELFKKDINRADQHFKEANYHNALTTYLVAYRKNTQVKDIPLRIARCYFKLKEYEKCIDYIDRYLKVNDIISDDDLYLYAEAQAIVGNYESAIDSYKKITSQSDDLIMKKIWRLSNIHYLYEDSMHFVITPIDVNTTSGELCAAPYRDQLIFTSNRHEPQLIAHVNASLNTPFYKMYTAKIRTDSLGQNRYGNISLFDKAFASRLNAGPAVFYHKFQKMVFVSSANTQGKGLNTLQFHFAEWRDERWHITHAFPYNSEHYSVSDPAINEEGTTLYFSSDMSGGVGGKDIYQSTCDGDGNWSAPINLGNVINTPKDETFPYLHQSKTLYFSSDGHPGIGGLDIFRSFIKTDGYSEPENVGFPLNSSYDDFGIVIDSLSIHGFLSSNRVNGGYDDDIFEFDIDMQTYPVEITGIVKYKEHQISDSTEIKALPNANIDLIDNISQKIIARCIADNQGHFMLSIPHFSKYTLRIRDDDNKVYEVILDIPKHRQTTDAYEIVIVKDVFR